MKNNIFKYVCLGLVASLAILGCRKDSFEGDETKDSGNSYLKVNEGSEIKRFFSPFTDIKDVHLFSLRKDAANNAELNVATTVKLTADAGIVDQYNEDHGEDFELLPESFYTLSADAGFTKTGTGYDVVFGAGDFSKNFKLKIDGSKWSQDLSKKYAIAFKISDFGGLNPNLDYGDEVIVLLSIKNKYDGVYTVAGTMVDVTNGGFTHINDVLDEPMEYELRTLSPTTCALYDNTVVGGVFTPFATGGAASYYGSWGVVVEFDPATDKVVKVSNYYGVVANTRAGRLDPSGINQYDPSTKTVEIKYNMLQPNTVTTAPFVRTTWTETWTFARERE